MRGTPPPAPAAPAPLRWVLVAVVYFLLPLGILGAFALSAAATVTMFQLHHVPGVVLPASVAMVEVVNLAGSGMAVASVSVVGRWSGVAATVAVGAFQLVAGTSAYQWVGAFAPLALIGLVHLASVAATELRRRPATEGKMAAAPVKVAATVEAPAATPVEPAAAFIPGPAPFDLAPSFPVHGPKTLLETVREAVAAEPDITARELDRRGWCKRHTAGKLLAEVRSGLTVVSA